MSFRALVARFASGLEACGAAVSVAPVKGKPARVRVTADGRTTHCLVFLWNITPGGGSSVSRPKHERRIQVTAAERFPLEIGTRTIIGGWDEPAQAWGFWDVMRHTSFSEKSPSFQINEHTLDRACEEGVAAQVKRRGKKKGASGPSIGIEAVVAVSPPFLLWYVEQGESLHHAGPAAAGFNDLLNADPESEADFRDAPADAEQGERRFRLMETVRAVRDARFRPAVLQAYSHQCALCPISLNLVDAAHIVPIRVADSTDDVTNGLALCRLHHAAYDGGLVGVKSDYSVVINTEILASLQALGFAKGLDEFRGLLRATLRHPAEQEVRPRPGYLRRGMEERNWPASMIG